ncbi:MAG: PaaI family thioesterase [bacterium]
MASPEEKQRQERLIHLFHGAPIAQTTGMRLHYNDEGQAVFEMPYHSGFDHALHQVHGGLIATMVDNAGWFTAAPHFDRWVATVEFTTRLHEPVEKEALTSRGRIVRLGKRLVSCEMEVKSSSGKLIATGAGTFAVTSVPFK